MTLQYNSPVVLNFALLCTAVLLVQDFTPIDLMPFFLLQPVFSPGEPLWYLRLFSHVAGHGGWGHLAGNFMLILLVGPILEEKYGSSNLLLMILFTALVTALLHIFFFSSGLLGASGIAFMMIVLISFANAKQGSIPLTFILVMVLYVGKEVLGATAADNISQFAHIIGGVCGGIFGFVLAKPQEPVSISGKPPVEPPVK